MSSFRKIVNRTESGGGRRIWVGVVTLVAAAVIAGLVVFVLRQRPPEREQQPGVSRTEGCPEVPFHPTSLPLGISSDFLADQSSAQESPASDVRGTWPGPEGIGVDVVSGPYHFSGSPTKVEEIPVLDGEGTIATDDTAEVVSFSYGGCDWALAGHGVPKRDLRRMAEGLIPSSGDMRSACREEGVPYASENPPPGWASVAHEAEGRILGTFHAMPEGSRVEVYISEDAPVAEPQQKTISVLGGKGAIGGWDEGTFVTFRSGHCSHTLLAYSEVDPVELQRFAESLRPRP